MAETTLVLGWRVEFDLAAAQGSQLVGAILEARVTAANDARTQPVDLPHYEGTGTMAIPRGRRSTRT